MAHAVKTAMCLAVLGVIAFSLQGCEVSSEHLEQYKAAALQAIQGVQTAAVTAALKEGGGCPPLLAAIKPNKDELVHKTIEKVSANAACTGDLIKSAECQKIISFELADMTMFYAEADPGFKDWVGEHKGQWEQVSAIAVSTLEGELMAPVKVMQQDALTDNLLDPKELSDVLDGTMGVFCPASDAEVAAADTKDAPLAAAAKAAAAAEEKAKEAAYKVEVLEEEAAKADVVADKTTDAKADATADAAADAAAKAAADAEKAATAAAVTKAEVANAAPEDSATADAAAKAAADAKKAAEEAAAKKAELDAAAAVPSSAATTASTLRRLVDDIQI